MKWKEEDINTAKEMLKNGYAYKDIGILLGRSDASIRMKLLTTFNIKRTDYYNANLIKKCKNCENDFEIKKGQDRKNNRKFCSNSCSTTFNNTKRKKKEKKLCVLCNSELHTGSKFCNSTCQKEYNNSEKIRKWLNNEISGHVNGGSFSLLKCVRSYIMLKADNKCEDCGENRINTYSGKYILTIDHIDGDASNNKPENLKVLCPNCHAMTSTYGNINGRVSARKRYRKKYR